jgi:hypothetical protein
MICCLLALVIVTANAVVEAGARAPVGSLAGQGQ